MFFSPLFSLIEKLWRESWGTEEDAKVPIRKTRLIVFIVHAAWMVALCLLPLIVLQIKLGLFNSDFADARPENNLIRLVVVAAYLVIGLLASKQPVKTTLRAWLGGKGKWWWT